MKIENVKIGTKVQAGEGDDHDTGWVSGLDGEIATVNWDSLVQTEIHVSDLDPA